jgi:uncharacterized protein (TIRG00374 family)
VRKQLALGVIVAVVCLYFAFRGMSVREVVDTMRTADPRWIGLALSIYLVGFLVRTVRWRVILSPIKPVSPKELFPIMMIGYFANNVLPFRIGELVRAHLTGRRLQISRTASFGTIILERLFDTVSFLSTFVFSALFFKFPPRVTQGAWALSGACILLILGLITLVYKRSWIDWGLDRLSFAGRWQARLRKVADDLSHGIAGMFSARHGVLVLFLSLVVWIIEGTFLYLIGQSYGVPLSYPQSFFLLFFLGLAVTLPQAPGYVGTLELFGVAALSALGIPKEKGLPLILTIHGFQFLMIMVLGLWALWREGLSVGKLLEQKQLSS